MDKAVSCWIQAVMDGTAFSSELRQYVRKTQLLLWGKVKDL